MTNPLQNKTEVPANRSYADLIANNAYFHGILSFILYSISLLIGYREESTNHLFMFLKASLIVLSAFCYFLACSNYSNNHIKLQYSVLSFFIFIYNLLLFVAVGRVILYIRDYPAILNSIAWTIVSLVSFLRNRKLVISVLSSYFMSKSVRILSLYSAILAIIVVLLSIEPNGIRFSWDSDTLYDFAYKLNFESLYDAKLLTFHSHVSVVYLHLIVLLKLLFRDLRIAFFILNALCITAASFGMTFLLRELVPGKKNILYVLGNAMFLFSPWVCGMSTYHIYDYYIWCLFPILILFAFRRNWTGFFVISAMITFSKASGLIVIGSVCVAMVLVDLFLHIRKHQSIWDIIKNRRYLYFLSIALAFYIFFNFGIARATQFEDTRFGFDPLHSTHTLKMYASANFLWIPVILTLILVYRVFIANKEILSPKSKTMITILLISDILFVVFNCLCITYRIPRYMDSHIPIVYICATVLILNLSDMICGIVMGTICAISLIGSFRMIDPVSMSLFNKINVGNHRIVDYEIAEIPSFGDSIICNREYYSYEVVLDKALTYVINDMNDGDDIMLSLGDQELTWGFSGGRYSYHISDGMHYFREFYDRRKAGLANGYSYEYYHHPDMIPFETHYIFPEETISEAALQSSSTVFYYIYMPTLNSGKEKEIYNNFPVESEEEFSFRGWKINCIKFTSSPTTAF